MHLKEAIDNLYGVFSFYIVEGKLRDRSCDCCIVRLDVKTLMSRPLNDLTENDLGFYTRKAITTLGSIQDYKHFLPRILELVAFSSSFRDDFLTFEKLNYCNWQDWDDEEVISVKSFFAASLTNALNENLDTLPDFIALNLKYNDFETIKKILLESDSIKLIRKIIDDVLGDYRHKMDDRLMELYSNKKMLEKIEHSFFETQDKVDANNISIAYSILEKYHGNSIIK